MVAELSNPKYTFTYIFIHRTASEKFFMYPENLKTKTVINLSIPKSVLPHFCIMSTFLLTTKKILPLSQ